MSATSTSPPVTPDRIMQISGAAWASRALATALELRVFELVRSGRSSVPQLVEAIGASERGLRMLTDALVALGFLTRNGVEFGLPPDVAEFLIPDTPHYFGGLILFSARELDRSWGQLTDAVRSGKPPVLVVDRPEEGVPFWRELVGTLFPLAAAAASVLGAELGRLYPRGEIRILDVAAGSGVWGIQPAKQIPRVRVTAMDLPGTLEITREFVERCGVEGQFEYQPGDLREVDFGSAAYDVAILGQICHSEGEAESKRLIAKMARAIRPGGTLVIAERFPDPERSRNASALLFALNMLLHTTEGDTWSVPVVSEWLAAAGFNDPRTLEVPAPDPLLLATRGT